VDSQNEILELKKMLFEALQQIFVMEKEIEQLKEENLKISKLEAENKALMAENDELKARLNQNSSNSSKPSSSDGYKKIEKQYKRESPKLRGGQVGHKGGTLLQIANPDNTIKHLPSVCSCGHQFSEADKTSIQSKRQVFEIPEPKLIVTEHQSYGCKCPKCGKITKGAFPDKVNAPVQYGDRVKSFVIFMDNELKVSKKNIGQFFLNLFGYAINESAITTMLSDFSKKLLPTEEKIKEKIKSSEVGHADETGIRVDKKLNWLHVLSTSLYTYLFVHEKRGKVAMRSEESIIPDFKNWLVHDCLPTYFGFDNVTHSFCNAHIVRELQSVIDNDKDGLKKWAKKLQDFLLSLNEMEFSERIKKRLAISEEYYRICKEGFVIEPPPKKEKGKKGRPKSTKSRNLLCRLAKYKKAVLAFAFNENVPFTNNQAERDLRPAKVKLKVSNCFRSSDGAKHYARIQGFISTAKKNHKNIMTEIYNTFNGYNFITEMA